MKIKNHYVLKVNELKKDANTGANNLGNVATRKAESDNSILCIAAIRKVERDNSILCIAVTNDSAVNRK